MLHLEVADAKITTARYSKRITAIRYTKNGTPTLITLCCVIVLGPPTKNCQIHKSRKSSWHRLVLELRTYLVDELLGFFTPDRPDRAHFLVVEQDSIEFIGSHQHLWSERRRDELCRLR